MWNPKSHLMSWQSVSCVNEKINKLLPPIIGDIARFFLARQAITNVPHLDANPQSAWSPVFFFLSHSCHTFASFLLQPAFDTLAAAFLIATTLPPLALFLSCLKCRLFQIPGCTRNHGLLFCFIGVSVICAATWSFLSASLRLAVDLHLQPLRSGPPLCWDHQQCCRLSISPGSSVTRCCCCCTFTRFYPLFTAPTFSCILCSALAVSPLGFGAVQIFLGCF